MKRNQYQVNVVSLYIFRWYVTNLYLSGINVVLNVVSLYIFRWYVTNLYLSGINVVLIENNLKNTVRQKQVYINGERSQVFQTQIAHRHWTVTVGHQRWPNVGPSTLAQRWAINIGPTMEGESVANGYRYSDLHL